MTLDIAIAIESDAWSAVDDLDALVHRSVAAALAEAGSPVDGDAELSVLFCDDAAIRTLNRDWRGKDTATNVLSFPAAHATPPGAPHLLGDIAVAIETVRREAEADGKPLGDHVAHLIVHGLLHLLGHDHEAAAEAVAMERLEQRVMARLGIADPYAGSEPLPAGAA